MRVTAVPRDVMGDLEPLELTTKLKRKHVELRNLTQPFESVIASVAELTHVHAASFCGKGQRRRHSTKVGRSAMTPQIVLSATQMAKENGNYGTYTNTRIVAEGADVCEETKPLAGRRDRLKTLEGVFAKTEAHAPRAVAHGPRPHLSTERPCSGKLPNDPRSGLRPLPPPKTICSRHCSG